MLDECESIDCGSNDICEEVKPDVSNLLENEIIQTVSQEESGNRISDMDLKTPYIKWHDSINKNLRLLIKSEIQQEDFKGYYISYLRSLKENLPYLLPYPKRCRCVAKKMTRILFLFKSLYCNTTEIDLYNAKMCELLSVLTTLELKHASNFDELKIKIVNRLCLNYDIHLKNLDVSHILRVFLYLNRNLLFDQAEVLTKIFEKYLKQFNNTTQTKLDDKLYCMYLVAYHLWVYIETDIYEKNNIKMYANKVIAPQKSLRLNVRYAPFLPEYSPDEVNITKFILDKGFNRVMLVKALIADDSYEDAIINLCDEDEPQIQIIDLDEDLPNKEFETLQIAELPEVKYETPELVAMIDLTENKEDTKQKNSPWLNKLIRLTRQAKRTLRNPPKNPSNTEIINLDDSDIDNEEEIEEEEASQTNEYSLEKGKEILVEKELNLELAKKDEAKEIKQSNNKPISKKNLVNKINEVNLEKSSNKDKEYDQQNKNEPNLKENCIHTQENAKDHVRIGISVPPICNLEFQPYQTNSTQENNEKKQIEDNPNGNKEHQEFQEEEAENSISSSPTNKSLNENASIIIPIFDEDLTFVTNYASKTYSKKKVEVKKIDLAPNNDLVPNINDKNQNIDGINEVNSEITSSTTLITKNALLENDKKETKYKNKKSKVQLDKRKTDSEKVVHRFFTPKKVNFAPLPEKHIANPVDPAKKVVFGKRICKESDKIQTSFMPPAGTEAFKLYESQNYSLLSQPINSGAAQKSKISSTVVAPIMKSNTDTLSASALINLSIASPTNTTLESSPTASSILAATGVKTRGSGNVSGTPYVINRHSPNNFTGFQTLTIPSQSKPVIYKPNFYDYSLTTNLHRSQINENSESNLCYEKPMSDFDLYLLKLRESKKEVEKRVKLKIEQNQNTIKKVDDKKIKTSAYHKENKLKYKKCQVLIKKLDESASKSGLVGSFSLKPLCVQVKRLKLPARQYENELSDMTQITILENNGYIEDFRESIENNGNDLISAFENKRAREIYNNTNTNLVSKSVNTKSQIITNVNDINIISIDSNKQNIIVDGRKNFKYNNKRKNNLYSKKSLQYKNTENPISGDDSTYKNIEVSYNILGNIVENIENHKINLRNYQEILSTDDLNHSEKISCKRKFYCRQIRIKLKRLKLSSNNSKTIEHNQITETITTISTNRKETNNLNSSLETSEFHHIKTYSKNNIVSPNSNSILESCDLEQRGSEIESAINSTKRKDALQSLQGQINNNLNVLNNKSNNLPNSIQQPLEIPAINDVSHIDISSNLNLNGVNLTLNDEQNTLTSKNSTNESVDNNDSSKTENNDSSTHVNNEFESISQIKEITSTQESEVSSSLDLQNPIMKRRRSRNPSTQDNEIPSSKDFASDCDETASNAPTTTTIIDFVVTTKKRRQRQKKIHPTTSIIPNNNITIANTKAKKINFDIKETTMTTNAIDKNNLKKSNKQINTRKLNEKMQSLPKTGAQNTLRTYNILPGQTMVRQSNKHCHPNEIHASNDCHSKISLKSDNPCQNPSTDNFDSNNQSSLDVDMSNYNLNHQHLNNFLYNSRFNWLTKQHILNDINSGAFEQQQLQQNLSQSDNEEYDNFMRQHLQEQLSLENQKKNQPNQLIEPHPSSSLTQSLSIHQQKLNSKPSGKPQAFLAFMNSRTLPKKSIVRSENIIDSNNQKTFCDSNKFNEKHFCKKKNLKGKLSFKSSASEYDDQRLQKQVSLKNQDKNQPKQITANTKTITKKKLDIKETIMTKKTIDKNHSKKSNKKIYARNVKGKMQCVAKTYSKNNLVSTVFVPPDIEEMIDKDIAAHEKSNV